MPERMERVMWRGESKTPGGLGGGKQNADWLELQLGHQLTELKNRYFDEFTGDSFKDEAPKGAESWR